VVPPDRPDWLDGVLIAAVQWYPGSTTYMSTDTRGATAAVRPAGRMPVFCHSATRPSVHTCG
jgi:hypothetical protein